MQASPFTDIQDRCRKAQFIVAGKRVKFGIHTDDIQKIFINLSAIAGNLAKLPTSVQPGSGTSSIQVAMANVETVIATGSVKDLDAALAAFVAKVKAAWEAAQGGKAKAATSTIAKRDQFGYLMSEQDQATADSFADALKSPLAIRIGNFDDIRKHQAAAPVKKKV